MMAQLGKKACLYAMMMLSLVLFTNTTIAKNVEDSQAKIAKTKLIVLVRHAEKSALPENDPELSPAGERRAQALIASLKATPLNHIIASQFTRTQATVMPISEQRDLSIHVIPAKRPLDEYMQIMKDTVIQTTGNVLIAGHSNTVPMLIKSLGGPDIPEIGEEDYGSLYILSYPYASTSDLVIRQFGSSEAK